MMALSFLPCVTEGGGGESLIIHWGRIYMQMSKSGDRTSEAHAGHMSLRCLWSAKNRRQVSGNLSLDAERNSHQDISGSGSFRPR